MSDLLSVVLLGVIEGVTEFLPISSTGHLLIAEHWLGARSDTFNVVIQAGAILAVTFIYRARLWRIGDAFRAARESRLRVEARARLPDHGDRRIRRDETRFQVAGEDHADRMGAADRRRVDDRCANISPRNAPTTSM